MGMKNITKSFIVEDWAGNEMNYGTFATFEDAWDYLLGKFSKDEDLQEYFVTEVI